MKSKITLFMGDITSLQVDAIVNAANRTLLGGGGVDGAIHRAAGPELLEACRHLNGCDTGSAKITPGFQLPASYVIHTVGPVWRGGNKGEDKLLKSCYIQSLKLAVKHKLSSIAFPNISTGVYGFPKERAADIAINTVKEFLEKEAPPLEVTFVLFDSENESLYNTLLEK
jgi:O-acetyl-ADP-ribose deacetylase (regulator of RNase III)